MHSYYYSTFKSQLVYDFLFFFANSIKSIEFAKLTFF